MEAREKFRFRPPLPAWFGEQIDRDGATLVPVHGPFGARGAYVMRHGSVRWMPAFNLNWVIAGGQMVATAAVVMAGGVLMARAIRGH
ncbi:MAG TPA: hypothetical protein VIC57_16330 [Candidatus Dormibacteraeota bacterium]|jgi:hypothetical protein